MPRASSIQHELRTGAGELILDFKGTYRAGAVHMDSRFILKHSRTEGLLAESRIPGGAKRADASGV